MRNGDPAAQPSRRRLLSGVGLLSASTAGGALLATNGPAQPAAAGSDPPVEQGSQVVSVTDAAYGATGNGQSDDTAAFTKAAAAAAPGGILLIPKPPVQYLVSGNIPLPGQLTVIGPGWDVSTPTVKLKDSSGASCVFASQGYLDNAPNPDGPIIIRDLSIDVNGTNNTGVYGIVLMTARSKYDHIYLNDPGLAGLVFSDRNSAGTVVAHSMVENRISDCTVVYPNPEVTTGQYGIWVIDTDHSGALTDGYCTNNVVASCGDFSLRIERSAGWFITGNHSYHQLQSGMYFGEVWCTFIHHNEVDHFGDAGAASTTYYGFDCETILPNDQPGTDGRPSFIDHNFAAANEAVGKSTTTYHYFRLRNASTIGTSIIQFDHNVAHQDAAGAGTSVAWDFQPNGTTMNLIGGFNVADGPSAAPVKGGGTLNVTAPSRIMYSKSQAVTLGLSGSYGQAVDFSTEEYSLGFIPVALALVWAGPFEEDSVTAKWVATYSDGSTNTQTWGEVTSAQTQSADDGMRLALYKDGVYLVNLAVAATTTQASTAVTLRAEVAGFNAN
jgi:hypothetical protein